jgi:hypothetical protein
MSRIVLSYIERVVMQPTNSSAGFQTPVISLMQVLMKDRLCGLAVRVLGHRSGGPGSIPGTIRKKK